MKLTDSPAIYVGNTMASRVIVGGEQLWPPAPSGPSFVGFDDYLVEHDPMNITPPAGTAAGDLCLVAIMSGESSGTGPPSGFTALDTLIQSGYVRLRTGWKVLSSGEASSITLPGDGNFSRGRYGIWIFRAAAVDDHAIAAGSGGSPDSVLTIPSVTPAAGSIVVAIGGGRDGGVTWTSTPPGHSIDWDQPAGFVSGYGAHYTAAGGATGTQTITNTGANFQQWLTSAVEIAGA